MLNVSAKPDSKVSVADRLSGEVDAYTVTEPCIKIFEFKVLDVPAFMLA